MKKQSSADVSAYNLLVQDNFQACNCLDTTFAFQKFCHMELKQHNRHLHPQLLPLQWLFQWCFLQFFPWSVQLVLLLMVQLEVPPHFHLCEILVLDMFSFLLDLEITPWSGYLNKPWNFLEVHNQCNHYHLHRLPNYFPWRKSIAKCIAHKSIHQATLASIDILVPIHPEDNICLRWFQQHKEAS